MIRLTLAKQTLDSTWQEVPGWLMELQSDWTSQHNDTDDCDGEYEWKKLRYYSKSA